MTNGAFTFEFAAKKQWKLDEGLFSALLAVLPKDEAVVELGSGIGRYVVALREEGYNASGFDGIPGIFELSNGVVSPADLSQSIFWKNKSPWVISFEVGEHIAAGVHEEHYIYNVATAASHGIMLSWAIPGQRGRDHINCRMPEYVACEFGRHGWHVDGEQTTKAREIAGKGWNRKLLVLHKSRR
jgi:hypothetical protein